MASNSILNPAPNPLTVLFNPLLWDKTEKIVDTTVIPDDPASLLAGDENTFTEENTFNGLVNMIYNPIIRNMTSYVNNSNNLLYFTTRILNPPLSSVYLFGNTAYDGTLTIPTASQDYEGLVITFRRTSSSTYQLLSASSNLVVQETNPMAYTNVIIGTGFKTCTIVCAKYPTLYAWFIVKQY